MNEHDWVDEYLDYKVALKVVNNLNEAIQHIDKYGTKHSEEDRMFTCHIAARLRRRNFACLRADLNDMTLTYVYHINFASESSKRALKEFDQVIVRLIDHYLQQAEQRKKIVSPHRHVTAYLMYKTYMMLTSPY